MNEKIRIFGCGSDAPIKCDVCGRLISSDGFLHCRRSFDMNVLIAVEEGALHITSNGAPHTVSAGQYILLKAGEEHFGSEPSEGGLSYLWAHFSDVPALEEGFEDGQYVIPEYGEPARPERVFPLFRRLTELYLDEAPISGNMPDYALSLILMEISGEYRRGGGRTGEYHSAAAAAEEWIKANFRRPFTLTELAETFGYRADYLSTVFKRSTGVSVMRYANLIRIRAAKVLLASCDISIKEAAFSCGFSDEKYFMRVFKSFEGITPTQYKRSLG